MAKKQPEDNPIYETPGPGYPPPPDLLDSLNDLGSTVMNKVNDAVETADFAGLSASVSQTLKSVSTSISRKLQRPSPYVVHPEGKKAGSLAKVMGYGFLTFITGCATLGSLAEPPGGILGTAIVVLILFALTDFFGQKTKQAYTQRKLFKLLGPLARIAAAREVLTLEEIAVKTETPLPQVKQLVKNGIKQGYIPQGRIRKSVDGHTVLYLTTRAFEQAGGVDLPGTQHKTSERLAARNKTAATPPISTETTETGTPASNEKNDTSDQATLNPKVANTIAKGTEYIQRIHSANELIQEAEMSQKLDVLEDTVRKITTRVRERPDTIDQLTQFINYYLPTTGKLVDAYVDLEKHNEHGPNAESTRKEIKATIDIINESFIKLSDDLLQDAAWDLQSDMHVLRTMLTQDGLADDHGPRVDQR